MDKNKARNGAAARKSKQKPAQAKNVQKRVTNAKGLEKAPVTQSRRLGSIKPDIQMMGATGDNRVRVRHTEFIGNVVSGVLQFNTFAYAINPGLVASFPWLSNMAVNYEKYEFRRLEYYYEPITSTATAGSVMMVVDFDADDAPPASKVSALANNIRSRCSPWQEDCMKLDGPDLKGFGPQRFIRDGAITAGQDIKTYDVGNLFICTSDATTGLSVTWGELHVSYEVDLITPQLHSFPGINRSVKIQTTTGVNTGTCFGNAPIITGSLPIAIVGQDTIQFNTVGQFYISILANGSGFGVLPTITSSAASYLTVGGTNNGLNTIQMFNGIISISAPGETIQYDPWTGLAVGGAVVVRIAPYEFVLN